MNIEVVDKEVLPKIPKVGEVWKHEVYEEVYMRIMDDEGTRALEGFFKEGYFYSVNLKTGKICSTFKSSIDIIILEPVDGAMKFKRSN